MTLSAPLAVPRLGEASRWWFVCLYTGGVNATDSVLSSTLPPLLADARRTGASRWFFIRYFDERGPHIRLRVFGPGECMSQLVRATADLQAQLRLTVERTTGEDFELVPGAASALTAGSDVQIGVYPSVYEPETVKYGGIEAMDLAERLFEFSSELALWAVQSHAKGEGRDPLASLLLADTAGSLLLGRGAQTWSQRRRLGWAKYWSTHTRWWTGADHDGGLLRDHLELRALTERDDFFDRMRRVAIDPDVDAWRRRWVTAVDDYLGAVAPLGANRTPQHLTFHHSHMLMNRLGFLPKEEALLGLHARAWITEVVQGEPTRNRTTSRGKDLS